MRRAAPCLWVLVACLPDPGADLAGPRVVRGSMAPGEVEVPVVPDLVIELSEAPDPATLTPRHIALVRWEQSGRCDVSPSCDSGRCARGRCWEDPLSSADLSALDRGEYEDGLGFAVTSRPGQGGAGQISIELERALEPHARYGLVLGAGIRDPSGAGLEDSSGLAARWRRDFVTAGEGSAGPEPRLVFPAPDQGGVPTNLQRMQTSFARPVLVDGGTLVLSAVPVGHEIELVPIGTCDGWARGFCLEWSIPVDLEPSTAYRVLAGSLADASGRGAVVPHADEGFVTAPAPDFDAPSLSNLSVRQLGPCLVASFEADEPVRASFGVGGDGVVAEGGGLVALALRVDAAVEAEPSASIRAMDLAGNETALAVDLPSDVAAVERLAMTEILANALGPEPAQEFVELLNFGVTPVDLHGLWIADRSWDEIELALSEGADPPGDPLPGLVLEPGRFALAVASGFDGAHPDDPDPVGSPLILRVDGSLGAGGLKNAGEPLSLYRADPPRLVASYGNHIDTSATAHAGRSVSTTRPEACDLPSSWRSHPLGTSTPGRLP